MLKCCYVEMFPLVESKIAFSMPSSVYSDQKILVSSIIYCIHTIVAQSSLGTLKYANA